MFEFEDRLVACRLNYDFALDKHVLYQVVQDYVIFMNATKNN